MGRFEWDGYYESPGYNNAAELFEQRARTAIYSKRGRRDLANLREALMALPQHELIEGAVCRRHELDPDDGRNGRDPVGTPQVVVGDPAVGQVEVEGVCAIGAYLWWGKVKAGADPVQAFLDLPEHDSEEEHGDEMFETAWAGQGAGLTYTLAWELASANDETFARATPAERWQRFIDWIDNVLAAPPLRKGAPPPGGRIGQSWTT